MKKPRNILRGLAALEGNLDEELARLALLRSQGKLPLPAGEKIRTGPTIRSKIDVFRSHVTFLENQCWEWKHHLNRQGYGVFYIHYYNVRAHRFSFAIFNKKEPLNWVCHHCDNPLCVNPDHLFEGRDLENIRDCFAKGRHPMFGELNPNSKLTELEVIEIRRSNLPTDKLASIYKVRKSAIRHIKAGITWKHLPFPDDGC